jgi:hypothetical protein
MLLGGWQGAGCGSVFFSGDRAPQGWSRRGCRLEQSRPALVPHKQQRGLGGGNARRGKDAASLHSFGFDSGTAAAAIIRLAACLRHTWLGDTGRPKQGGACALHWRLPGLLEHAWGAREATPRRSGPRQQGRAGQRGERCWPRCCRPMSARMRRRIASGWAPFGPEGEGGCRSAASLPQPPVASAMPPGRRREKKAQLCHWRTHTKLPPARDPPQSPHLPAA